MTGLLPRVLVGLFCMALGGLVAGIAGGTDGALRGALLGGLLGPYIAWSMERELRVLKRLVEEPGFLAEALRTGNPRQLRVDPSVEVWDPNRPTRRRRARFAAAPTPQALSIGLGAVLGALTVGGIAIAIHRTGARRRR